MKIFLTTLSFNYFTRATTADFTDTNFSTLNCDNWNLDDDFSYAESSLLRTPSPFNGFSGETLPDLTQTVDDTSRIIDQPQIDANFDALAVDDSSENGQNQIDMPVTTASYSFASSQPEYEQQFTYDDILNNEMPHINTEALRSPDSFDFLNSPVTTTVVNSSENRLTTADSSYNDFSFDVPTPDMQAYTDVYSEDLNNSFSIFDSSIFSEIPATDAQESNMNTVQLSTADTGIPTQIPATDAQESSMNTAQSSTVKLNKRKQQASASSLPTSNSLDSHSLVKSKRQKATARKPTSNNQPDTNSSITNNSEVINNLLIPKRNKKVAKPVATTSLRNMLPLNTQPVVQSSNAQILNQIMNAGIGQQPKIIKVVKPVSYTQTNIQPLITDTQRLKKPVIKGIRVINKSTAPVIQPTINILPVTYSSSNFPPDDLEASFAQLNQDMANYCSEIPAIAQPATTSEPLCAQESVSAEETDLLATVAPIIFVVPQRLCLESSESSVRDNSASSSYIIQQKAPFPPNKEIKVRLERIKLDDKLLSSLKSRSEAAAKAEKKALQITQINAWLNTQSELYSKISNLIGYIIFHRFNFHTIFASLQNNISTFVTKDPSAFNSIVIEFICFLKRVRQIHTENGKIHMDFLQSRGSVLEPDLSAEDYTFPKTSDKNHINGKSFCDAYSLAYRAVFKKYCSTPKFRDVLWDCMPLFFNLSDYFNANLREDYKRYMNVPTEPTRYNVYSSHIIAEDNSEFLIYWLFDWLQYISSNCIVQSFNSGKLIISNFLDLSPYGNTVNVAILLYCALTGSNMAIYTRDNPDALALWKRALSAIFMKDNGIDFFSLIRKFSTDIVGIRSIEIRPGARFDMNHITGSVIEDLKPALSEFIANIFYSVHKSLFAVHNQNQN